LTFENETLRTYYRDGHRTVGKSFLERRDRSGVAGNLDARMPTLPPLFTISKLSVPKLRVPSGRSIVRSSLISMIASALPSDQNRHAEKLAPVECGDTIEEAALSHIRSSYRRLQRGLVVDEIIQRMIVRR
jgi:hypothetical protein